MVTKGFPFLVLQVLLVIEAIAAYPCSPCAGSLVPEEIPSSYGGDFIVITGSPVPPSGVSVLSENMFEGTLSVEGRLPFIGTVALEGALPTAGAGTVAYGCGSGNVGMVSEEVTPAGYAGRGMNSRALGCGVLL